MIETKLLEIRDHGTFIPAIAIRVENGGTESRQDQLIGRAGFRVSPGVYLMRMVDARAQCDPYEWGNDRTHKAVHDWLYNFWHDVQDGGLVDVRVILGETTEAVGSELR